MIEILKRMWAVVKKTLGLDRSTDAFDPPIVIAGDRGTLFVQRDHLYLESISDQVKDRASALVDYNNCFSLRAWIEFDSKDEKVNRWYFISVWKLKRDRPISQIPYLHRQSTHAAIVWRGGRYHNSKGRLFLREVVFCSTYEVLQMMGELDNSLVSLLLEAARKLPYQPIETIDWARETSRDKYVRRLTLPEPSN